MEITKKYVNYNFSKRTDKIKYIVIHDTGNKGKGADAMAHYNYFNGGNRNASAHYFVDDKQVVEIIDPDKNYSWHCGDGKGKFGITNNNSIGIEICINSDGDFSKAYKNCVELTKTLMKKYGIDNRHIVRHYDASLKMCPNTLINGHKGFTWDKFTSDIGNNVEKYYRVCIGSYKDIENARKKAKEVGGFIVEYYK